MSKEKLPLILLFFLSAMSLFRLFTFLFYSSSSSSISPIKKYLQTAASLLACPADHGGLTHKEFHLLHSVISNKSPCNLLVFGVLTFHQASNLSYLNTGGKTVFIEDDEEKLSCFHHYANKSTIYRVKYPTKAGMAYELLRLVRVDSRCSPQAADEWCPLNILSLLPQVVGRAEWDVVVVDGPSGDTAEAPGMMEAIYTAAVLARRSPATGSMKGTEVVVHDNDRMVEKLFSWEFLCRENLVASKGKLWHFHINNGSNSSTFCFNSSLIDL